jgi:hypothetical protein
MIGHYSSQVIAEDHYYPFGLTASLDANQNVPPNTKKYQSIELEKHFGLETYFRGLDPQLGKFNSINPKAEMDYNPSPYATMIDNPVSYSVIL